MDTKVSEVSGLRFIVSLVEAPNTFAFLASAMEAYAVNCRYRASIPILGPNNSIATRRSSRSTHAI